MPPLLRKLGLPTKVAPWPSIWRGESMLVSQPPDKALAASTLIARPGLMRMVSRPGLPLAWANAQAKLFTVALVPQLVSVTV